MGVATRVSLMLSALALGLTLSPHAEAANGYYNGLKLPFAAGETRVVVRSISHGPGRHAVDFGMTYENVLAMYAGRVVGVGTDRATGGKFIIIDHGDNFCSLYLHLDRFYVTYGQTVQQGAKIALSGNTGRSTGPHLHAAVFYKLGGACSGLGGGNEVMMLFDEHPRGELMAGEWVTSRNGKPVAPFYPSLDKVMSDSMLVKWNDYADNEQGFKVERRQGKDAWVEIASVGANVISYVSDGLAPSSQYCYRVRSFNEVGASGYSNAVCATTQPSGQAAQTLALPDLTIPDDRPASKNRLSPLEEPDDPAASATQGRALLYNSIVSLRMLLERLNPADTSDGD